MSGRTFAKGRREASGERAALLVAALLLLLGLNPCVGGQSLDPGCRWPRELRAEMGRTVEVSCEDGISERPLRGPARLLFGLPLDLNRADRESLESLPAIGPTRAAAIHAARCQRPFRDLADVARVPGIGPRTLAGLVGWVSVEAPVTGSESGVGCDRPAAGSEVGAR